MESPRLPPVAVCPKCDRYFHHFADACPTMNGKKRCRGAPRSSIGSDDWITCGRCGGNRERDGKTCEACQASGFIFVRDRPWLRPKAASA